jgi:hypothetical protein
MERVCRTGPIGKNRIRTQVFVLLFSQKRRKGRKSVKIVRDLRKI